MTSQPLETITEEPTPTPAPARVTADPPKTKPAKNPGARCKRQEAGRTQPPGKRSPEKGREQRLLSLRLVRVTSQLMTTTAAAASL